MSHTQECDDYRFCHHAESGGDAPCICGGRLVPEPSLSWLEWQKAGEKAPKPTPGQERLL